VLAYKDDADDFALAQERDTEAQHGSRPSFDMAECVLGSANTSGT
jgi:hypothetical protein